MLMAEPAFKPTSLDEFLRWDDGTDTRYKLIGGFPVSMNPPVEAHWIPAMRIGSRVDAALANRRPCNAQIEAGVIRPDRADTFYIADIAVTCASYEAARQSVQEVLLIASDGRYGELHRH
jgi:Uma2 family endonuclease